MNFGLFTSLPVRQYGSEKTLYFGCIDDVLEEGIQTGELLRGKLVDVTKYSWNVGKDQEGFIRFRHLRVKFYSGRCRKST